MMEGEQIFVSQLIMGSDSSLTSTEKKAKEKEKILAMCYFMRADERRYGNYTKN